ncbi:HlyD family efflux transporter periplasmic adaptor subunit [Thalassoroseus pseudoceratinae]|uniref:HlyD family efflux transporter periplasmic adaptor subunit n=1 Tax=Thalassoroseus pseudoceratinae TaxID=2713176 RepID=UPI001422C78C|nr:HlyD family efflux transporter periplasmic adaptor subunit [Thalassoroseus pseudoceratinae]
MPETTTRQNTPVPPRPDTPPKPTPRPSDPRVAVQIVSEIEQLATSEIAEDQFFGQWLEKTSRQTGAVASAVWMLDAGERIGLLSEQNLDKIGMGGNRAVVQQNLFLLGAVLKSGEPVIHVPGETGAIELPSEHVLLLVPLRLGDRVVGVAEHFLPTDSPELYRLEHLQFLEEAAAYAGRYLSWRDETTSPDRQLGFWSEFERTIGGLHRSLDPQEVALTAANDGRKLLNCDRVSIAVKRGVRTEIIAVSGQARVKRRSNLIRAMRQLARPILRAGQPITYVGHTDGLPPSLLKPLTNFVKESRSRMVRMVPLLEPSPLMESERQKDKRRYRSQKCFGVLIVERTTEGWLTPPKLKQTELLADHLGTALHNARTHHQIFLLSFWKFLGRIWQGFHGRIVWQTLLAICLLAGVACGLAFIPADYRVEGTGQLMPSVRQEIFAPWDGEVTELAITGGDHVNKGDVLLKLHNDELNTQQLDTRGRLAEKQQLLKTLEAGIASASRESKREEEIRLRGRYAQTAIEIRSLSQQLIELESQIEKLTVRAPIDGTVSTFQVEQLLQSRPVRRGERLLEVMNEDGPWRLELKLPERRLGHLLEASTQSSSHELPVDFVLATDPERRFSGSLGEIATRTSVSATEGSVIDVHVDVDAAQIDQRRIGAEVRGKIHCGQKSLFYVLFGDVVEFAQSHLW